MIKLWARLWYFLADLNIKICSATNHLITVFICYRWIQEPLIDRKCRHWSTKVRYYISELLMRSQNKKGKVVNNWQGWKEKMVLMRRGKVKFWRVLRMLQGKEDISKGIVMDMRWNYNVRVLKEEFCDAIYKSLCRKESRRLSEKKRIQSPNDRLFTDENLITNRIQPNVVSYFWSLIHI